MATLSLKNIPDDLYESLKWAAETNHRSINGEVISMLERNFSPARRSTEEMLKNARKLRSKVRGGPINQDAFDELKREGRP